MFTANGENNGLLEVHLKVNMTIHLLEITEAAIGKPRPDIKPRLDRWKLMARCASDDPNTCHLLKQIYTLGKSSRVDGKAVLSALNKLMQVAQTGQPLENFYDKKQSHQLHAFEYENAKRVVWRLRQGDVRLVFYYAEGKMIFLADALAKRQDKLTSGEKIKLENEIKTYIDAELANKICVIQPEVKNVK